MIYFYNEIRTTAITKTYVKVDNFTNFEINSAKGNLVFELKSYWRGYAIILKSSFKTPKFGSNIPRLFCEGSSV